MKKLLLLMLFLFIGKAAFAQQYSNHGGALSFESAGDGYRDAIIRKVSANIRYSGNEKQNQNLEVSFLLHMSSTGGVSIYKLKGSGVAEFDKAIWEGILRASPLPKRKDGTVDAELMLDFREK